LLRKKKRTNVAYFQKSLHSETKGTTTRKKVEQRSEVPPLLGDIGTEDWVLMPTEKIQDNKV
jgi:hypothetical protein